MSSIDNQELFEKYYQSKYDYDTNSLSEDDVIAIKDLVKKERIDYALAPIGVKVFDWIIEKNTNIKFENVDFISESVDGLLYIPQTGKEKAYIILNGKKPLVNQIFTAAHEYYHYIKDYQRFKEKPYVCDFSDLKDVNERKASRFAAELLIPELALKKEVEDFCRAFKSKEFKNISFELISAFIILMTVKYQIPIKAMIYRLLEEKYIDSIDKYIQNYDFIKKALQQITILEDRVKELYQAKNQYISSFDTYKNMEIAYNSGEASREDIIRDALYLNLKMDIINDILGEESYEDDSNDDDIISIIKSKEV